MATRAVLLDVGCVLIHPREEHFRQAVRNRLRLELPPNVALPALGRTVWRGAADADPPAFWAGDGKSRAWAAHAGLPPDTGPEIWRELAALDTAAHPLWSCVDPDARDTLARLKESGLLIAAVSNADGRLDEELHAAGLRDLIDVALDSAREGVAKPDPRLFERAAELLRVPLSGCLFLGDDPFFDIDGSTRAGVGKAILFDPYGVRPGSWTGPAIGSLPDLLAAATA